MASFLVNPVTQRRFSEQSITSGGGTGGNVLGPGVLARVATSVGALTVKAPAAPAENTSFAVFDVDGAAPSSPITVDGNGSLIDGATSAILTQSYGEAVFVFDAGQWRRTVPQRSFGLSDAPPTTRFRDVYDQPLGLSPAFITPPLASAFSLLQTGANGALVDQAGTLFLSATRRTNTNDRIVAARTLPAAPYTCTAAIQLQPRSSGSGFTNYSCAGLGLVTATQGINYLMFYSDGGGLSWQKGSATSLIAGASTNFSQAASAALMGPGPVWLRVSDDGAAISGTNITFSYSVDGLNFAPVYQEARDPLNLADRVGFFVDAFNAPVAARLFGFSITSP